MIVRTQLGEWMESERLAKGLTKGKISEKIGISVGQYSAFVGGTSIPRAKTMEKIAKAYKKSLEDIQAMLTPATEAAIEIKETACRGCDSSAGKMELLEAKLDYAIDLLEKLARK